jgi:hypothetical protein
MHQVLHAPVAAATLLLLMIAQTGCVTARKYRMAGERTPPAVRLDYTAGADGIVVVLASVIVHEGPGSWKQRARWDEYVVVVTNQGTVPLTVESAVLVDLLGEPQVPGADPWKLERLSETNWRKYGPVGQFVLGAGAFVGAVELSAIGYGVTGGAMSGVFFIMPAVLLADVVTVGVLNHRNKDRVRKEFDRRRLVLPRTIAPGQSVTGSFFFPVVPAPQRLVLTGQAGGKPLDLVLDLKRLAGLHLKPAEKR